MTDTTLTDRDLLHAMFRAAVDAAAPATCLPPHLPPPPKGRTVVVGAGKAAAAMAAAVEAALAWRECAVGGPGRHPLRSWRGAAAAASRWSRPAHPDAGRRPAQQAARAHAWSWCAWTHGRRDLLLCLISGGGVLAAGVAGSRPKSLGDKQAVHHGRAAAQWRADRCDINCVRKHLVRHQGRPPGRWPPPRRQRPGADHFRCSRRRSVRGRLRPDRGRIPLPLCSRRLRGAAAPGTSLYNAGWSGRWLRGSGRGDAQAGRSRVSIACAPVPSSPRPRKRHWLQPAAAVAQAAGVAPVLLGDAIWKARLRQVARSDHAQAWR